MLLNLPVEEALAGEVALLDRVSSSASKAFVGFWHSPQSLVAPASFRTKPKVQAACQASAARGWPVSFRATSGDVTPQGPGIANVTLCYALEPGQTVDIKKSFDTLCAPMFDLLGQKADYGFVDGAFCDGAYNITYDGLKFAGTAQRFRRCKADPSRQAVLSHAIFVLTPPSPPVFEALNAFLKDLGEDRVIRPSQHIGLPDHLGADDFFDGLAKGYKQRFPNLFIVGSGQD